MQIYTENRFCLPLFYLIVLGVALSIWICPDKAFATGASSGVHDDQPRQAPEGLPPSRMPEAFPGFSPDTPSKCPALAPQRTHDTSRFESRLFAMPLPPNLTPEQQQAALAIMREEGFPEAGTLLHCFNLDWATLEPWVAEGCFVAFGGALTFKASDDTREAAARVPLDRLLTETDAPYMAPEPLRGTTCGPEHVVFTAERLAAVRGCAPGDDRKALLERLMANARGLLDRPATDWQKEARL